MTEFISFALHSMLVVVVGAAGLGIAKIMLYMTVSLFFWLLRSHE